MSIKTRLRKLEAKAPSAVAHTVHKIAVDPKKGETTESVYLLDFGEP